MLAPRPWASSLQNNTDKLLLSLSTPPPPQFMVFSLQQPQLMETVNLCPIQCQRLQLSTLPLVQSSHGPFPNLPFQRNHFHRVQFVVSEITHNKNNNVSSCHFIVIASVPPFHVNMYHNRGGLKQTNKMLLCFLGQQVWEEC